MRKSHERRKSEKNFRRGQDQLVVEAFPSNMLLGVIARARWSDIDRKIREKKLRKKEKLKACEGEKVDEKQKKMQF